MAFNYSVSFSDPVAGQGAQDSVAQQALNQALAAWSNYISGAGTLNVQLNVENLFGALPGYIELADAGSTTATLTGATNGNGQAIVQNSAVHELTTGQHLAASDITVNVNAAVLAGQVSEPTLVTVFEHELMHGFGVNGYRSSTGQIGRYASSFDTQSYLVGGSDYFIGPVASYVYGGAVPLTTGLGAGSNYYHVGATGTASDPAVLRNDLIYPINMPGQSITGLDVGILEDIGVPVTFIGQALIDPNPTTTIHELAGNGTTSVTSAAVAGTTQPDEVVLLYNNGALVATAPADTNGTWAAPNAGLADGAYQFNAEIYGAGGLVTVGSQYVVLDTASPLHLAYWQIVGRDATAAELAAGQSQLRTGTSVGSIRQYLAGTGYAAAAISRIYTAVLNRAVTQPELAADEQSLVSSGSVGALQQYLSTSTEAGYALGNAYAAVLGRWLTSPELAAGEAQLANFGSVAGVRAALATGAEAAAKIAGVYSDVVARAPTAAELTSADTAIGSGTASLAGLRAYFATTAEAAGKLQALYSSELGRAITPGELSADEQSVAAGNSLAAIESYLSTSGEAARAIQSTYANTIARNPAAAELSSGETALAGGTSLASLQAALAASPAALSAIASVYQTTLGVVANADDLATGEQALRGGTLTTVQTAALNGPEFDNAVNAAFLASAGRPANPVEIAADRSELTLPGTSFSVPVTVATIEAQIAELSGGPPPRPTGNSGLAYINAQTVPGSAGYVSGLLNNDALISATPESVVDSFAGLSGVANLQSFHPATDVLQIQSKQTPTFSALNIASVGGDTVITLGGGAVIDLYGIATTALTATNFRFV